MTAIEGLIAQLLAGNVDVIPVLEDAILENCKGYLLVTKRGFTQDGTVYPPKRVTGRFAFVQPGVSIRIFGIAYQQPYDRTFTMGDIVEYDSFNLSYHGPITSIGPRGHVTVHTRNATTHKRLDLAHFTLRNWDLDLDAAAARNERVSQSI